MPRQNRVDPFGRIVAHPARGALMGNRGCLHDDHGNIVRTSASNAWISRLPRWPGIRRQLMRPGYYTELFFLDEATALATGHRPCGACRPQALAALKAAWQRAFGLQQLPRVGEIDATLRSEEKSWTAIDVAMVPNGSMVEYAGSALLRWQDRWFSWTPAGYVRVQASPVTLHGLTSHTMCRILVHGYHPGVHKSAADAMIPSSSRSTYAQ